MRMDDDGNETPISATLYRNSEQLNPYSLPDRHQAYAPERGIVAGIIVNPTQYEDVGTQYQCGVEVDGEEVVRSRKTNLLVGGEYWGEQCAQCVRYVRCVRCMEKQFVILRYYP